MMSDFIKSLSPEELVQVRTTIAVHDLIILKCQLLDSAVRMYGYRKAMGMIPAFTSVEIELLNDTNMEAIADSLPSAHKPPILKGGKVGWVWRRAKASLKVALTVSGVTTMALLGATVVGGAYWAVNTIPDLPPNVTSEDAESVRAREFLQVRQALYQDVVGINDDIGNFTNKVLLNESSIINLTEYVQKLDRDTSNAINLASREYQTNLEDAIKLTKYEIDLKELRNEVEALMSQKEALEKEKSAEEREAVGLFEGVLEFIQRRLYSQETVEDIDAKLKVPEQKFVELANKYKAAGGSDERVNELFHSSLDDLKERLEVDKVELQRVVDFWNVNNSRDKLRVFKEGPLREAFLNKLKVRVFEHLLDPNNVNAVKNGEAYARDVQLVVHNIVPNVFNMCIKVEGADNQKCSDLKGTITLVRHVFDGDFLTNITNLDDENVAKVDKELMDVQDLAMEQRRNVRKLEEFVKPKVDKLIKKLNELSPEAVDRARVILRATREVIPAVFSNYTPAALPFLDMCNAELDALLFKWVIYLGEWKQQSSYVLPTVIAGTIALFGSAFQLTRIDFKPIVSDQIAPFGSDGRNVAFGFETTLEIPYAVKKRNRFFEEMNGTGRKKTVTMKDILSVYISSDEVLKLNTANQEDGRAKKMLDLFLFACYILYSDPRTWNFQRDKLIWKLSLWWNEEKGKLEFYGDNPNLGVELQETEQKAFHFRNILFMMFGLHADKTFPEMINYYRFLSLPESIYRFYKTVVQTSSSVHFLYDKKWNERYKLDNGRPMDKPVVQVIRELITYTKPSNVLRGDVFYEWIDISKVDFKKPLFENRAKHLTAKVFHTEENVAIMSTNSTNDASKLLAESYGQLRNFDFLTQDFKKGSKHLLVLADLAYLDVTAPPLNLLGSY